VVNLRLCAVEDPEKPKKCAAAKLLLEKERTDMSCFPSCHFQNTGGTFRIGRSLGKNIYMAPVLWCRDFMDESRAVAEKLAQILLRLIS